MAEPHDGHRERLRQSYLATGGEGMHEHQLLELLLTYAIPRKDTNPIAHSLIDAFGSLSKVLSADPRDLMQVAGIGLSAAVLLSLAGRLRRVTVLADASPVRIDNAVDAQRYCRELLRGEKYETLYAVYLDKNRRVLRAEKLAKGSLTEARIYPRIVVEQALRHSAMSVILCHNHPSGDMTPSPADVAATKGVRDALTPLGITLHDHIIVASGGEFSMLRGNIIATGEVRDGRLRAAEPENPTEGK